jgi:ubiquinone biosynthesis protein COQ9
LDEYKAKETYNLTGTEVNTITPKTVDALSNLIKTKVLQTADINDNIYQMACDLVLNLYFGTSIDTTGRDNAVIIKNEIVRNANDKNQEKIDKEKK